MARAETDNNGFIEIKNQKLSSVGVYEYLGSEINGPDPQKIYKVLRPAEELKNPETIKSFKLLPWVIRHKMLGKNYNSPVEKKGVHGVVGEEIYFDDKDRWLKGNVKIFSSQMEEEIDTSNIDELSLGYSCEYDFTQQGMFEGKPYDVVQKKIRGNHLALVEKSRMKVRVMDEGIAQGMDSLTIKISSGEDIMSEKEKMKDEEKKSSEDEEMKEKKILDQMKTMHDEMKSMHSEMKKGQDEEMSKKEMKDKEKKGEDEEEKEKKKAEDEEKEKEKKGEDKEEEEKKKKGEDSLDELRLLKAKVAQLEKKAQGMDSKSFLIEINERNHLANKISEHVGTFDHSSMNKQEVAEYGVKKLNISCEKGNEIIALDAALQVIPTRQNNLTAFLTNKNNSSVVDIFEKKRGDK